MFIFSKNHNTSLEKGNFRYKLSIIALLSQILKYSCLIKYYMISFDNCFIWAISKIIIKIKRKWFYIITPYNKKFYTLTVD